jgi:CubicO group peptidase (beta-lactamase class C family)
MMRLVEQENRPDAPVKRPENRVQDEAVTRGVKIWHLLTHTPGWEGQLTADDRGPLTLANFIESMRDLPKLADPGEVWSYNNAGFNVAGRVIEVASGQTIHNAFRTLVFEPRPHPRVHAHRGARDAIRSQLRIARPGQDRTAASRSVSTAAGGVSMSLNDPLAYARFIRSGQAATASRCLRASLEPMRTPKVRKNATDEDRTGWYLARRRRDTAQQAARRPHPS